MCKAAGLSMPGGISHHGNGLVVLKRHGNRGKMKVTYLYHSGFAVEMDNYVFIFDYYRGELPVCDQDKTIVFFASHKHQDHFQMKIFDLYGQYKKLHYFLSSDIRLSEAYLERWGVDAAVRESVTRIGKNQKICWQDITVETLRSTDEGVAFIVSAEGKVIYHGGDLNWWHWEGEEASWNERMAEDYKSEISRIEGRHFDVAFVPLDPRLGSSFGRGMEVFLQKTDAAVVFPMHMWEDYSVITDFKKSAAGKSCAGRIMEITVPGQEFRL